MCDIKGMFYQVRVAERDRDLLCFLSWKGGDTTKEPTKFRLKVHLFGATSSPRCANYALKMSANENKIELGPEAANFIHKNFYVDDRLTSVESVDGAVTVIKDTTEMCRKGGFKLHKIALSHKVIKPIPIDDQAAGIQNINLDRIVGRICAGIVHFLLKTRK